MRESYLDAHVLRVAVFVVGVENAPKHNRVFGGHLLTNSIYQAKINMATVYAVEEAVEPEAFEALLSERGNVAVDCGQNHV